MKKTLIAAAAVSLVVMSTFLVSSLGGAKEAETANAPIQEEHIQLQPLCDGPWLWKEK